MGLRLRKLKFFFVDNWPELLLLVLVVGEILWFARALIFAMEFDR